MTSKREEPNWVGLKTLLWLAWGVAFIVVVLVVILLAPLGEEGPEPLRPIAIDSSHEEVAAHTERVLEKRPYTLNEELIAEAAALAGFADLRVETYWHEKLPGFEASLMIINEDTTRSVVTIDLPANEYVNEAMMTTLFYDRVVTSYHVLSTTNTIESRWEESELRDALGNLYLEHVKKGETVLYFVEEDTG